MMMVYYRRSHSAPTTLIINIIYNIILVHGLGDVEVCIYILMWSRSGPSFVLTYRYIPCCQLTGYGVMIIYYIRNRPISSPFDIYNIISSRRI